MPVQEATPAALVDVVDVAPPPKVSVNSTSGVTGQAASKAPWPISGSVPSGQVSLVRLMVCSTGGGSWPASGRLVGSAGGTSVAVSSTHWPLGWSRTAPAGLFCASLGSLGPNTVHSPTVPYPLLPIGCPR